MGLIRKVIKWFLFIIGAFLLAYLTALIGDLPIWLGVILFFVYLGIIVVITHLIRKKIYERRTGFIGATSALKVEHEDSAKTFFQVLRTIARDKNKFAKKRFFNDSWQLCFEFDNQNLSHYLSQYEISPKEVSATADAGASRWFWVDNLVLIKPNLAVTDSGAYDADWIKFLKTVKQYRKSSAFNKIILSISVKTLLNQDKASLQHYAEIFKQRLLQVTDATGYQIPIVVMLSDLDMLSGYSTFVDLLSEQDKQQALGIYNLSDKVDFSLSAFELLVDSIDDCVDRMSYDRKQLNPLAGYHFSQQLRELESSWRTLALILFEQNLALNLPLSGLFLLGTAPQLAVDPPAHQLIFIDDLLRSVLNRQITLPILTEDEKQRQERSYFVKLATVYALVAILIIYVIIAFVSTSRNLVSLLKAIPQHIQYTDSFEQNLLTMTEYNNLMNEIIAFRGRWTVAILPFDAGLNKLEQLYARHFVEQFQQNVVVILDKGIVSFFQKHGKDLTSLQRGYLIQNLVARINIIQAKLNNQPYNYIEQLSAPELHNLGFSELVNFQNFGTLYKTYVIWQPDATILRKEKGILVDWLTQFKLLSSDQLSLQWLVDWANTQSTLSTLSLSYFWHGNKLLDNTVKVEPAYTNAGKATITAFISEINHAAPAETNLNYQEQLFNEWYEEQRLATWGRFALNFNKGIQSLDYKTQWDYFYNPSIILSVHGPYYQLLDMMYNEFATSTVKNPPIWLLQLKQFYSLLDYQLKKNKLDAARNITVVTRDFLRQIASKPSALKNHSAVSAIYRQNFDNELKAAQSFIDYQANLNSLYSQAAGSQGQLFGVAKAIYETNGGKVEPQAQNVLKAFDNYNTMRQLISNNLDQDSVFWLMLRGPFDYYIDYVNRYGSCYLQQQWVSEVLTPTSGLLGDELTNTLFGQNGLTWTFLTKYANSFLAINANLFVPQIMFGHIFPFSDEFYNFINSGITIQSINREQSQFENYFNKDGGRLLTITSSATNVNEGAKLLPYQTVLSSICNKQTVEIKNYNFPASQNINWSLGECGPAQITVYFNGLTLTKSYPGKFGFAKFLHDFARGPQVFTGSDFPESQKIMQAYNLQQITVNYSITGLSDVLYKVDQFFTVYNQLIDNEKRYLTTGSVPANITLCWKNSVMEKIYNQEEKDIVMMLPQTKSSIAAATATLTQVK